MGLHLSILVLGLSALILSPLAEAQRGGNRNGPRYCKDGKPTHVKLPSEIFEDRGLDFDNPCPNLDNSQVPNLSCKEIVNNLESTVKDYMQVASTYCDLRADAKNECGNWGNKECWQQHRQLLREARGKVNEELGKLRQAQSLIRDLKGILADEVIQPATEVLNGAKHPSPDQQSTAAMRANATSGQTVLNGANHYRGMDSQRIMELARKVREGGVSESDISGTGAMAREPAQVALAMQDLEKQLETRRAAVEERGRGFDEHAGINEQRADTAKSLVDSNLGKDQAAGAGGLTGTENGTTLANAAQFAGPAATAAGALAGSPGAAPAGSSGYAAADGLTYNPGAGPSLAGPSAPGAPGSAPVAINVADAAKRDGEQEGGNRINSSAASSGSERLRAALRDRLARSLASKGGGGQAGEASYAGAGVVGGEGGAEGEAAGGVAGVSPAQMRDIMGTGRSRMGGSGFLDGQGFALSGSETDAYVQSMIASMSPESESAEDVDSAPEILGADTASLFTRTRETYRRTVKKGLVTYGTSI